MRMTIYLCITSLIIVFTYTATPSAAGESEPTRISGMVMGHTGFVLHDPFRTLFIRDPLFTYTGAALGDLGATSPIDNLIGSVFDVELTPPPEGKYWDTSWGLRVYHDTGRIYLEGLWLITPEPSSLTLLALGGLALLRRRRRERK